MMPVIVGDSTGKEIVPFSLSENPAASDLAIVEAPVSPALLAGEVTAEDIIKAENFGVIYAFRRHQQCEPKVKVKVALALMETLYANSFSAKVAMFVRSDCWNLLNELDDAAVKAEFAIRVAHMMKDKEEQSAWCRFAMQLLQNEATRAQCPKAALETLAMIWAGTGNHDQTIHWLTAAEADRDKYKEATFQFFLEGAFEHGLEILDHAPAKSNMEDDFIDLMAIGLRNKSINENSDYQTSILKYQNHWQHRTIILRALCHLYLKEQALHLAKEMVSNCNDIGPLLVLSNDITEVDERRAYLDILCEAAKQIDERNNKTDGYGKLNDLVQSNRITIFEAITIANFVQKPGARVRSLWGRACGISIMRDKEAEDLRKLQAVLSAVVVHLQKCTSTDYVNDEWRKVLQMEVEYGFLEEAKALEGAWREWRKGWGEKEEDSLYQDDAVHMLCFFAVLKYLEGNTLGAIEDLKEGDRLSQKISQDKPNWRDSLDDHIDYVKKDLRRSPVELTALQSAVLEALVRNPRHCEQIFKLEKEIMIITPLNKSCANLINRIYKISLLTQQSLAKRVIQTLQYKILTQSVTAELVNVKAAAVLVENKLSAYRGCFFEEHNIAIANALGLIFQKIQEEGNGKWSLRKINKLILPLEQELRVLYQNLVDQQDSLNIDLYKFRKDKIVTRQAIVSIKNSNLA